MVEIVKSTVSRLEMRKAGNSVSHDTKSLKSIGSAENVGSSVKLNSLESQSALKDMASAAPVDKENVNRIKDAIKRALFEPTRVAGDELLMPLLDEPRLHIEA